MGRHVGYPLAVLALALVPLRANAQLGYRPLFGTGAQAVARGRLYLSVTGEAIAHPEMYDPATARYIHTPATTVFNDVGLRAFATYGVTRRLSLFTEVPLRSVHLYSLAQTRIGKGVPDITMGGTWRVLGGTARTSLDATLAATLPVAADTAPRQNQYPLALDAPAYALGLTATTRLGAYALSYSGSYTLAGSDGALDYGDWADLAVLVDRDTPTPFGHFSFAAGLHAAYKAGNRRAGASVPASWDDSVTVLAGATYHYNRNLDFKLGVPYTIYQKDAWFGTYAVLLGVEYDVGHP